MKEKISVIVPIYNVETYLKKCIESIINQTYRNMEIILVDDGSIDKSSEICDEYSKQDNRVIVIHKQNGGLSDARNTGIETSTGELLAFVDGDDWIDSNMISCLYNNIISYNADISECQYEKTSNEQHTIKNEEQIITISTPKEALNNILETNNINNVVTWNKLYRKELFQNVRFPKNKIHEDEFTTYKLIYKANKIISTNSKLYYYRQRENSIISEKFNVNRLDVIEAYDEKVEFYKKNQKELLEKLLAKFLYILIYDYYKAKKNKFNKEIIKTIKNKYRMVYRNYKKENKIFNKEKIKYTLLYIWPNLIFILPIL